jgi:hypothetical protein
VVWLRLDEKRSGPRSLELDLVVEDGQVDAGLWLGRLGEQLRAGDRVRVFMALEPGAPAADAPKPCNPTSSPPR